MGQSQHLSHQYLQQERYFLIVPKKSKLYCGHLYWVFKFMNMIDLIYLGHLLFLLSVFYSSLHNCSEHILCNFYPSIPYFGAIKMVLKIFSMFSHSLPIYRHVIDFWYWPCILQYCQAHLLVLCRLFWIFYVDNHAICQFIFSFPI